MTHKQKTFADAILAGSTGRDAYRSAYNSKGNNKAIAEESCRLSGHPEIKTYIAQEQAKAQAKGAWTREEMLETLKEIATQSILGSDRTRAIAQASKMLGFDAPNKVEQTGSLLIRWDL